MEKSLVHECVTLETLGEAAKAVEPGKEPFHDPTVAGKFPVGARSVFEFSLIGSATRGDTVADTTLGQREAKSLAVVAAIRSQATGSGARASPFSRNPEMGQNLWRQRDVVEVSCRQAGGHRQAITFYDQVALGSLTGPRAPDFVAPFLAFT